MKRKTKLGLGGALLAIGTAALTGCTASFCSTLDKAHMMYAFDFGVSNFSDTATEGSQLLSINGETTGIYVTYSIDSERQPALQKIVTGAQTEGIDTPSLGYWKTVDQIVLEQCYEESLKDKSADYLKYTDAGFTADYVKNTLLHKFGYLKFYYTTNVSLNDTVVKWENWDAINAKAALNTTLGLDELPSADFVKYYKTQMNNLITNYRSCIATVDGEYGYYGSGNIKGEIILQSKSYGYAWSRGPLEGLIIWPIAALTDVIASGLVKVMSRGLSSLLAIIAVTVIVRAVMVLFTFKQQEMSAKMNEIQPELAKIQAKYPNANTNQSEKMRLAEETQRLYKKHNLHPGRSMLSMFIQFPVFICVWGALQGSAVLSTGSFLGLNLSDSISAVLFSSAGWQTGSAWTALVLFILMGVGQAAAMLLPQWLQKKRQSKVARLSKNPAQNDNQKRMKMFTYVMLVMIIFMGFSLASGMGVYWFVSAIFSLVQTLITQSYTAKKKEKR